MRLDTKFIAMFLPVLLCCPMFSLHADSYSDRRQAQVDQYFKLMEQIEREMRETEIATVRNGVQRFVDRHGGWAEGPQEFPHTRKSGFTITFKTKDDLACYAVAGCGYSGKGQIYVRCIDKNLKTREFVPKGCSSDISM